MHNIIHRMIDLSSNKEESESEEKYFENSIYTLYDESSTTPLNRPTDTNVPENTYDMVKPVDIKAEAEECHSTYDVLNEEHLSGMAE